jgi:hypothetical protein
MGDLYLESVKEVKRYQSVFERNQAVALAPKKVRHSFRHWRDNSAVRRHLVA